MLIFIFFLYRLLQVAGFPLIVAYLLWRGAKDGRWFRSIPERLGGLPFPVTGPGGIWLHAVSVGEVLSAVSLLKGFRARLPDTPLYVSVTTVAGHELADQKLADLCDGIFYTPLDFAFAVRRVLRSIRPSLLLVLETEIWPNLWHETKRTGAGLMVANARISDRALPRYQKLRWFFRPVLSLPDAIYAQSEQDVKRYIDAGAPPAATLLGRNLKYDFSPDSSPIAEDLANWIDSHRPGSVMIAASTMPGVDGEDGDEDDLTLDEFEALSQQRDSLLWIHVPRRPERFNLVAEKLAARGIRHARRTNLRKISLPGVLLLDSVGELGALFAKADIVFMGGTLVRRGGHNILEPAFFGKPIIAGPHMENFAEIAREFTHAGALARINGASELAATAHRLLDSATDMGNRARLLAESKRGGTGLTVAAALEVLENNWARYLRPTPVRWLFTPASLIWRWAARRDRRKQLQNVERLPVPVVSVGGLSMGGAGKTPMVQRLTHYFHDRHRQPAILTRGYRKQSTAEIMLVKAGESAPVRETGDEAQIYIRDAIAHLGIGGPRAKAGRALLAKWHSDIVILDDGYQHVRLHRDFNLLMLDAHDGLRDVFPLGRLREEPREIKRADAIVLTRVQRGREYRRLRAFLQDKHPGVDVYRSRVTAGTWGQERLPDGEAAAFCGLGNPSSFWATLRGLGIKPVYRWAFDDHHQYRPSELQRLAHHAEEAGASYLLTTEKDLVNLPEGWQSIVAPLPVFSLHIAVEIENGSELLQTISDRIGLL